MRGRKMARMLLRLFIIGSFLLVSNISTAAVQEPDGTVKITRRSVAQAVGLSWGDGVLSYKGREYPFSFEAKGLFRNVDPGIAAPELSGQVFGLKNPEDLSGSYQKIEAEASVSDGGSSATIKNEKGVVVNLMSTVEGRKFNLGSEGISIELKKAKP